MSTLTPEERGEKAAALARQVVGAVHFGTRRDIAALLHRQDLVALTVALAAMVDPDRSVGESLAWLDRPQTPELPGRTLRTALPTGPMPCGWPTWHASDQRHRARGEQPCEWCAAGEREYQRSRPDRRPGVRARRPQSPQEVAA